MTIVKLYWVKNIYFRYKVEDIVVVESTLEITRVQKCVYFYKIMSKV